MRGMGKFGRMLWCGLPFLLLLAAAVIVFVPQKSKEAEARTVVRVWNIDTFEGGKGSRTAFLKSVARELKKLARRDDVSEHLAQSLAPEIFGHLDVKKALLLQMVGTNRGRGSFKAESRA